MTPPNPSMAMRGAGQPEHLPEYRAASLAEDAARARSLHSEDLLRGNRLVEIVHNGEIYRLQSTRLGKLILTK